MVEYMSFAEILEGLKEGKKYTCARWRSTNVFIKKVKSLAVIENLGASIESLVVVDKNRGKVVLFTPSYENLMDDDWVEV